MDFTLKRWADRKGNIVEWGNIVGPYLGQSFREEFSNEEEAKERERQAKACESICDTREPIALKRISLR